VTGFPSPLVAIIVLTIITWAFGIHVRIVADLGQLPSALPSFGLPQVPFTLVTLVIIAPVALTLAAVGLLESLLTAQIVDDMTDTPSRKSRECIGQGIANMASAVFGGMGGCAMIGQSVINVSSGGRGRLSTLVAGRLPARAAGDPSTAIGRCARHGADRRHGHGVDQHLLLGFAGQAAHQPLVVIGCDAGDGRHGCCQGRLVKARVGGCAPVWRLLRRQSVAPEPHHVTRQSASARLVPFSLGLMS
jgi:hypothetical protein